MESAGLRLGVYADLRYESDPDGWMCDTAFVRFLAAVGRQVGHLVVLGRHGHVDAPVATLGRDEADFVALPDYRSLADVSAVAGALRPSRAAWNPVLGSLDALLVFGPHPLATALVRDARRSGLPVVLGVRQYLPGYLAPRASPRTRPLVLATAHGLELAWQRLARRLPTIVTGGDLAHRYRRSAALLDVSFSLVDADQIVQPAPPTPWEPSARALSVGRLDPEKNPLLLADIAAGLGDAWDGWRLRAVGAGSLKGDLTARRRLLGVDDRLELRGSVPYGAGIRAEYDAADALVHVSRTEGQPQVLLEAMAAGIPIVATAVGGVASLLGDGDRGLLIPPDDAHAAVAALERLRTDTTLRARLVAAGHTYVTAHTTDHEAAQVATFVAAAVGERR